MVQAVHPKGMTSKQIDLLEHALRQITNISQLGWDSIPTELHPSFAKYMCNDVWTGQSDPLTLRETALIVIRDAIARLGEFADDTA